MPFTNVRYPRLYKDAVDSTKPCFMGTILASCSGVAIGESSLLAVESGHVVSLMITR